jgi:hypothetical protein
VRLESTFLINVLLRYVNDPTKQHLKIATKLVSYICWTPELGIVYKKKEEIGRDKLEREIYCEADMEGAEVNNFTIDNRSSINCHGTSGYIITIDGMIVMFQSCKQNSVSRSSTDKENLKQTLSQGFLSTRTCLVAICLNKITETIKRNNIVVHHITGKENPADILTKQISQNNRETIMKKINISGYYSKKNWNKRGECKGI